MDANHIIIIQVSWTFRVWRSCHASWVLDSETCFGDDTGKCYKLFLYHSMSITDADLCTYPQRQRCSRPCHGVHLPPTAPHTDPQMGTGIYPAHAACHPASFPHTCCHHSSCTSLHMHQQVTQHQLATHHDGLHTCCPSLSLHIPTSSPKNVALIVPTCSWLKTLLL